MITDVIRLNYMDEELLFLKKIGLAVAVQFVWIVPVVVYRWFHGGPLTAQDPPPDFRKFKIRVLFVVGIGLGGGLGISGFLTPPFRPILPSLFCTLFAALSLWVFILADRGYINYDD